MLRDFFGILAFSDFLKTNFVICSTKNMGKHFVLFDKLLHVTYDIWLSLHNIFFWHICNVPSNTHTHLCIRHRVQTSPTKRQHPKVQTHHGGSQK
jgi:hypothetical protein